MPRPPSRWLTRGAGYSPRVSSATRAPPWPPGPAGGPVSCPPTWLPRSCTATTWCYCPTAEPAPSPSGLVGGSGSLGRAGVGGVAGRGAVGGRQAELGPDDLQPGLGLGVGLGVLHLDHAGLDRLTGQLGVAEGLGVAGLDLGPHLLESRHVLADRLRQRGHGLVHLLLHLGLVQLGEQLL